MIDFLNRKSIDSTVPIPLPPYGPPPPAPTSRPRTDEGEISRPRTGREHSYEGDL